MRFLFTEWDVYDNHGRYITCHEFDYPVAASLALECAIQWHRSSSIMVGPRLYGKEEQQYLQALKRASDAAYHKQTELIESLYGVDTESRGARHSTPKAH